MKEHVKLSYIGLCCLGRYYLWRENIKQINDVNDSINTI